MKHSAIILAALMPALAALSPAVARADDMDDLDFTMEVVTDASELDDMIPATNGGEAAAYVPEQREPQEGPELEDESGTEIGGRRDARFEHDEQEPEEDRLEYEDDFEDGEDVDLDEI